MTTIYANPKILIRRLTNEDISRCETIVRSLPAWFGIESAIIDYIKSLNILETYVAEMKRNIVGFLALKHHNKHTSEIYIMAVDGEHHRQGVGTTLLENVERRLRSSLVEYLEVKTLAPSHPDPSYRQTREFYLTRGFTPLEEINAWGKDNPCLILIKHLCCGKKRSGGSPGTLTTVTC